MSSDVVQKGPVVGAGADAGVAATAAQQPPYYFVYYWRHKHDYLYFKVTSMKEQKEWDEREYVTLTTTWLFQIDPIKETVITSEWHMTKD